MHDAVPFSRWTRRNFLKTLPGLSVGAALHTWARPAHAATGPDDFAFIHLSDTHLNPRPRDTPYNPNGRSVKTLAWLCEYSKHPITQPVFDVAAGHPEFAIHTGDLFEYSVIDKTWDDFDTAFAELACPLHYVPGNHDNTWNSINTRMRQRFGGDSHSFDAHGCHFVCLNSAGLLDPLPCLDRRTVNWLRDDLKTIEKDTPVFLALHHPLSENAGYASDFDKLRLWDVMRDHHVVLMMDGHWHSVHARTWQGIDRINGGETFRKNPGFNTVTINDGQLRVMYRFESPNKEREDKRLEVPLVDKPVDRRRRSPIARWNLPMVSQADAGDSLDIEIRTRGKVEKAEAFIDGFEDSNIQLQPGNNRMFTGKLSLQGVDPGRHPVIVRARRNADGPEFLEGRELVIAPAPDAGIHVHERRIDAGLRATPVYDAEHAQVITADTSGHVRALGQDLQDRWAFDAGVEIVNGITLGDDLVLIADADGTLTALDTSDGSKRWSATLPDSVYGKAAQHHGHAIIGDAGGNLTALSLRNGDIVWQQRIADYGFEAVGCIDNDTWYGSAWDGFLYAIDAATGQQKWKSRIPSGHVRSESRYYGGADTTPLVWNDRVYATDRGYTLGWYDMAGQYGGTVAENTSAFTLNADGTGLLARHLDNHLSLIDGENKIVWKSPTIAGRVPSRPCTQDGHAAIVSDRGLLTRLDAEGNTTHTYRVSPKLFVLAEPIRAWGNTVVTSDMDGVITAVSFA